MLIDSNMIMSGVVSKGINNLVDFGWEKIKDANNKRKSHEQNIETRIYQVTVDTINAVTFNEYEDQDKLYIAAENIFRAFKEGKENIEAVKMGLKILESSITDDRCQDFLKVLCKEICKDENDILYKEISIIQNEEIIENVHDGFKRSEQNQEDIRDDIHKGFERSAQNNQETQRKLDYLIEKSDNNEANFYSDVENRAEEYAAKWDKNVFLNKFDEEDENPKPEVKLSKIYKEKCLPHYIWRFNTKKSDKLKDLLKKYIINNDEKKMLLILGQPGIGKSTLITWIIANFEEKKDDFLVYQFASDLKNVNWQGNDILCEILKTIHLKKDNLKNKVLILDGFDEIYANGERERILNKLSHELAEIRDFINFSLVITCRENYVYELGTIECDFITLQVWEEDQIECFCKAYQKESGSDISESKIEKLLEKKEVFGIPLILYMVLALGITIEKSESLVDVYDQIFSINRSSSIYDRCIKNSRYDKEHRISEDKIKQAIHLISQRIAFWIFENNSEKAVIPLEKYENICSIVIKEISNENEDIKRDVLIGNYFKLTKHCEGIGTEELQFVHRSIYEYFVVVYFFESLYNLITKEEVAGKLGELLKKGRLSQQILEFIKYKFDKIKKYNLTNVTKETFQIMLRDGMTYYIKGKYKNIIDREMKIFTNMLEVVHLWNLKLGELDKIVFYLQYNHISGLNLRDVNLRGANLSEANLSEANLSGADLSGAHLIGANLGGANLSEANLNGVYLTEAYLSGTNLSRANLSEVCLNRADLSGANLSGADLSGANLSETDLKEADLSEANLSGANLSEADLRGANLSETDLKEADLSEANLRGTNLSEADLRGANLSEADLSGANLSEADLREADLSEANLSGADLKRVHLSEAYLIKANLSETYLRGTNLSRANLSGANLSGTDLIEANLSGANLSRAHLSEANLSGANLSEANLSEADLGGTNLNETIFDKKQVDMLHEKCDLSKSKVYISEMNEIISYVEYCTRKQNRKRNILHQLVPKKIIRMSVFKS